MVNPMGWDKKINYEIILDRLETLLRKKNKRTRCYASILLIQLRNGSRISEAIEAYKKYIMSGKREVYVRVRKKRKIDYRLMIIPEGISVCEKLLEVDDRKLNYRLRVFALRRLGVNTHTLRYAFINHLLKEGFDVVTISKIIRHSKLDTLYSYARSVIAEDLLRKLF